MRFLVFLKSTDKSSNQENPCSEQFRFLLLRSFHLITLTSECHPRGHERVKGLKEYEQSVHWAIAEPKKETTTPAPAREEIAWHVEWRRRPVRFLLLPTIDRFVNEQFGNRNIETLRISEAQWKHWNTQNKLAGRVRPRTCFTRHRSKMTQEDSWKATVVKLNVSL